jgi:hypothetical protein
MKRVYLYGGSGKFAGSSAYDWNCPSIGSTHKLILFLAQDSDTPQQEIAERELSDFGFCEIQIGIGKPIDVEALNEPQMQAFQRHYEGAIAEGCSLVWYP